MKNFDAWRVVDLVWGVATLGWALLELLHGAPLWLIVLNVAWGIVLLISATFSWTRRILNRLRRHGAAYFLAMALR
jgi:hypothetical protein